MSLEIDLLTELKKRRLKELEHQLWEREHLPHRWLHKFYPWQWEFFLERIYRKQVVCAANQVGKTSSQIKKIIDMALCPDEWASYWPNLAPGEKPSQWWYLYPTAGMAEIEFREKWQPLLPKVDRSMGDEIWNRYGWQLKRGQGGKNYLAFNTGINVYFKSYSQGPTALQAGSVYLCAADEEVPHEIISELQVRTRATDGFMFFVFTATLGQDFWRRQVEEAKTKKPWPDAKVWQVGLYDCQKYVDGTPSNWTRKRIEREVKNCINKNEVARRVHGKFVLDTDLLYPQFDPLNHVIFDRPRAPEGWTVQAGLDYGTGASEKAHPAAIVVVAINPERTRVNVIRAWRGDGVVTTAQDIIDKFLEATRGVKCDVIYYDYGPGGRDVGTIGQRIGLPMQPAKKQPQAGVGLLQSLFAKDVIAIHQHKMTDDFSAAGNEWTPWEIEYVQSEKLVQELVTARFVAEKKNARNDDLADALKYALSNTSFDWAEIGTVPPLDASLAQSSLEAPSNLHGGAYVDWVRRNAEKIAAEDMYNEDQEFEFWQSVVDG